MSSSFISLLAFALLFLKTVSGQDPLFHFCLNSGNFTANDPYEANLNKLATSLSYKAPSSGFAVASVGQSPSKAFGLTLCRGDVSSADCKTCVVDASAELRRRCPYNKGAVIWYDNCLLKYSDEDFFGRIDNQNRFYMWNLRSVSDPAEFNEKTKELLSKLAEEAYVSPKLYAAGESELDGSTKLYGLTQCTRDLSSGDCKKCLDGIIGELPRCCDGKEGGRVVGPNCNFRYEIYPKPTSQNLRVFAVAVDPQELPRNSPQRLLKELAQRKRATGPKKKVPPRKFILKPPLDDKKLADRFLNSPQLSLKSFPLLSSCLPSSRLNNADKTWIDEYLLEVKQALGYPLEPSDQLGDDNPAKQFDTLLYLAFQHPSCDRANARHVKSGHSRLWFVGQYVLELAFAEYFLQRYPRESPGPMRERVFGLIGKRNLPKWIKAASLQNLIFPYDDIDKLIRKEREPPVKSVFWALFGAIYLCYGMPEVYRVLFEVFGMDPEAEDCQPKLRRQLEDVDYVSVEFDGKQLSWQDVAAYRPPGDALFAHPRLFRACVPPGMHRFRGNIWDYDSKPHVMQMLGYPLAMTDRILEITEARNIELGLGLQLCFLHPSKYKFDHPRFCYERLEYVGQKIQDLVMAERLLMKHLDAPGKWLQERHRRLLMNKFCGRYLRDKHLHRFIIFSEQVQDAFEHNRRLRNPATTSVQQALHGLSYAVYGKPDVRRLMFEVFDFEQIQPKAV